MADSKQIIAASKDEDLRERLIALAAAKGLQNPDHWVQQNLHHLVAVDLDGEGGAVDSIASVYDYAVATYQPTPRPGANMAAVTDTHIEQAIERVQEHQATEPPA